MNIQASQIASKRLGIEQCILNHSHTVLCLMSLKAHYDSPYPTQRRSLVSSRVEIGLLGKGRIMCQSCVIQRAETRHQFRDKHCSIECLLPIDNDLLIGFFLELGMEPTRLHQDDFDIPRLQLHSKSICESLQCKLTVINIRRPLT